MRARGGLSGGRRALLQAYLPELQEEQQRTKAEGGAPHEEATGKVVKLMRKVVAIACAIGALQVRAPSYLAGLPQTRPFAGMK